MTAHAGADKQSSHYALDVAGQTQNIAAVSMGNPHAVLRVEDVTTAPVASLGPQIESHPRFPRRVNAGFMQVVGRRHIKLRVYERGAGETLACGSGALAAAEFTASAPGDPVSVVVATPGGARLAVDLGAGDGPAVLAGEARLVYEGDLAPEALARGR